jgi:hypothetical protein
MKKILIILTLTIATVFLFAQDMIFSSVTANSDGKNVVVEWKTITENSISHFEIERAAPNQSFVYLGTEKARGYASSYSYKDDNVFLKDDKQSIAANSYTYRIKMIKKDNKHEYSNQVNVVHNLSGIQKTWGMIKEMFR